MLSKPAKITIGIGVGLVGSFFLFREFQKWQARERFKKLKQDAIDGKGSSLAVLKAITDGTAAPPPGTTVFKVEEAKLLSCEVVFPPSVFEHVIPQFADALAQMRSAGDCL